MIAAIFFWLNYLVGIFAIADILDAHEILNTNEMELNHRTHTHFAGLHADCRGF